MLRILAKCTLVFASCTVDGAQSGQGFACSEEEPCGSGLICAQGFCELGAGLFDARGASGGGDGGGNADAAEIDCLPSIALSDTFEGMTLDAQWTKDSAPGTSLDVSGGVLVLTPSSANQGRYAAARSEAFDFNNKRVAIEIAQMLNTQAAGIAELQVGLDDQNLYFLRQTGGVMQFGTTVAGTSQVRATAGFSVALHRWWQFRVLGGWIYADTSPDGQNWTELSSVELDGPVEFEVSIRAGTDRRINEPGSLHIDNVNSGSSLCQ